MKLAAASVALLVVPKAAAKEMGVMEALMVGDAALMIPWSHKDGAWVTKVFAGQEVLWSAKSDEGVFVSAESFVKCGFLRWRPYGS